MLNTDSLTRGIAMLAAVIGSSLFAANFVTAQDCQACNGNIVVENGCSACRSTGGFFGQHQRKYGSFGEWREAMSRKAHQHHVISEKVVGRNKAWPMPFDCADRQVYFSIWEPMIDQGFQQQTMLMNQHFDVATNQLNDYGKAAVSAIMRNMPSTRKSVFVQRHPDGMVSDSRLAAVKNAVSTWYGDELAQRVAFTDKWYPGHSGLRIQTINNLYTAETPEPWIPVATGTGNTSNVQVGN